MKRITCIATVAATLAIPSGAALGDAPNGQFIYNLHRSYNANECLTGKQSSGIIQNGQFVSQQATVSPGARADLVGC